VTVIKRFCILHRAILPDRPGNVTEPFVRLNTLLIRRAYLHQYLISYCNAGAAVISVRVNHTYCLGAHLGSSHRISPDSLTWPHVSPATLSADAH